MTGLPPWVEQVRPEWIDYNGHLSEAYYVLVFGHATDAVMAAIGLPPQEVERTGASLYTLEAHVRYLDQVPAGAHLEVRSAVIGGAAKTVWLWHELWVAGRLRATEEVLAVHVVGRGQDTRSAPFAPEVAAALERLRVPPPVDAARHIALR